MTHAKMRESSTKRWADLPHRMHPAGLFAAIFVLALFVRLVVLIQVRQDSDIDHITGDGLAYLKWARTILSEGWIGRDAFYQAPLYPYFLALVLKVVGNDLTAVRIIQACIGAAGCGILTLGVRRLIAAPAGLLAGAMLALYPAAISFDLQIEKTVLDLAFVSALIWCVAQWPVARGQGSEVGGQGSLAPDPRPLTPDPSFHPWPYLLCGLICGLFILTRENALVLVPVLVIWVIWSLRNVGWKHRLGSAATILIGTALVLAPVAIRNAAITGEFHLTTSQFGPNFYYGNAADSDGIYRPLRPGRGDALYERTDATELAEQAVGRRLTPGEVSAHWAGRTLRDIRNDPAGWAGLMCRKLGMVFADTEIADSDVHDRFIVYSPLLRGLDALWGFRVLLPLALAGTALLWDRRRWAGLIVALALIYAFSIALFFLTGRYRLPLVPMLIPLAAGALARLPALVSGHRWRRLLTAGTVGVIGLGIVWIGDRSIPQRIRGANEYNRAIAFAGRGESGCAIAQYHMAISKDPGLIAAYTNLGLIYLEIGQEDEAVSVLEKALSLDPNDASAHVNLGTALASAGALDRAIEQFRRALAIDPASSAGRYNLGAALLKKGDTEKAIKLLKAVSTLGPADPYSSRAESLLKWHATSQPASRGAE